MLELSIETQSLLHLQLIEGIGTKTINELLKAFDSAEMALNATEAELSEVRGIAQNRKRFLLNGRSKVSIDRELGLIRKNGCYLITFKDRTYPELLRQLEDAPPILYVKGQLPPEDMPSLAIVGTRNPTAYGKKVSYEFAYQLAEAGVVIVSGGARGCDTMAHRGAIDAGGRTIAVMGCGLNQIYPSENRKLFDRLIEEGALISEFPMTAAPAGGNFPRRNRLISGLTLGTVVVEAGQRSGSHITARCAAEQGRDVFAVPGSINSKMSAGTNHLIEEGAIVASSTESILKNLGVTAPIDAKLKTASPENRKIDPVKVHPAKNEAIKKLSSEEQKIMSVIGSETKHIDELIRATDLPTHKVSGLLISLEIQGFLTQLPGNHFTNCDS